MKPPPFTVASAKDCEDASYLVCVLATMTSPFTDNERGVCSICERAVIFRPYAPKRPPRICIDCMIELVKAH
jgi:hypothetical protein